MNAHNLKALQRASAPLGICASPPQPARWGRQSQERRNDGRRLPGFELLWTDAGISGSGRWFKLVLTHHGVLDGSIWECCAQSISPATADSSEFFLLLAERWAHHGQCSLNSPQIVHREYPCPFVWMCRSSTGSVRTATCLFLFGCVKVKLSISLLATAVRNAVKWKVNPNFALYQKRTTTEVAADALDEERKSYVVWISDGNNKQISMWSKLSWPTAEWVCCCMRAILL